LKKSKQIEASVRSEPVDKSEKGKKWQDILEKLKPDDFGKYKMSFLSVTNGRVRDNQQEGLGPSPVIAHPSHNAS